MAHLIRVTVRRCIDDLEIMAKVLDPAAIENKVEYLPF